MGKAWYNILCVNKAIIVTTPYMCMHGELDGQGHIIIVAKRSRLRKGKLEGVHVQPTYKIKFNSFMWWSCHWVLTRVATLGAHMAHAYGA